MINKNTIIIYYVKDNEEQYEIKRDVCIIRAGSGVTIGELTEGDYNATIKLLKGKKEEKILCCMTKEQEKEILVLEDRIYQRRLELLAEMVELAEGEGTIEKLNSKIAILEALNKLKRMFKHEFSVASGYNKNE